MAADRNAQNSMLLFGVCTALTTATAVARISKGKYSSA
jgi:hypothetical protein